MLPSNETAHGAFRVFFSIGFLVLFIGGSTVFLNVTTESPQESAGVLQAVSQKEEAKQATVLFGGDVMLSRNIGTLMLERDGWAYPLWRIAPLLHSADITFVNLEGPISSRGTNHGSIYSFRADPRAVATLTAAGIDVVSLANNHIFDWGPEALQDTVILLDEAGIIHAGAGQNYEAAHTPAVISRGGISFAFLAYTNLVPRSFTLASSTPAVAWAEPDAIAEDIRRAREQADAVIISFHFGDEYSLTHNAFQETLAHAAIDAGATLVIGHHPHVVQEVGKYKDGYIAYSLGNLLFDQNFGDTKKGLLLQVHFEDNTITGVQEIPVVFTSDYEPYLVE